MRGPALAAVRVRGQLSERWEAQLEFMRREHVLTVVPRPPGMSDKAYKQLMISKPGQERLWRGLWLIALRDFGARQLDHR
jgi:hypothetical protein